MPTEEEYRFAKTAVARKFCTKEQIEHCLGVRKDLRAKGETVPPFHEILVREKFLTPPQVEIIQSIVAGDGGKDPASASDTSDAAAPSGTVIGGYEILKKIDKGAMGTVYKARQISMDRIVAFKILSKKLSRDMEFVKRFEREARATAKLSHPNIILGIDVGEADGRRFFVMEYVDGKTVQELLKRGGAMDEKRALGIVLQIARALDHAHRHHLVHRDVKPENIMVTRDGSAKLCDLGLAKLTNTDSSQTEAGKSLGTPNYISPEQARGETSVDIRSDVYSLGASLFHMVVGQVPFTGSPAVVMTKHIHEELPDPKSQNPEIMDDTCWLIRKMMAKDAKDRYQTPRDLILDLERLLEGERISPEPPGQAPGAEKVGTASQVKNKKVRRRKRRRGTRRFRF